MTTHRLVASQFVPRPLPEVFDFFSRAENLRRITPPNISTVSRPHVGATPEA
jgi:ligand-binding SRPBCC domain-containing protein